MAEATPPHRHIEDYALIGNTFTGALVARNGAIDWFCAPRFDAPAMFAALLGTTDNGTWRIAPAESDAQATRRYRDHSMVLETEFKTEDGVAAVIDCMPLPSRAEELDIVRIVEGRKGAVPFISEAVFRFDYGRVVPWVTRRDCGIRAVAGPDGVLLSTPIKLQGENFRTIGRMVVHEGECIPFLLTWYRSRNREPEPKDPLALLTATDAWWRNWCNTCTFTGAHAEMMLRSLLTLKALTYSPTGGIAAAATTSLPERLGGKRNWDYRFCWLRDSTFTLYALLSAGFTEEARAWREWLLRAVAGMPSQMQSLYGLEGERMLTETVIPWLPGFARSAPVRIGNAACDQVQLDVYGEIVDSFHTARAHGIEPLDDAWHVQKELLDYLESHWDDKDNGIWEMRGPRQDFTHSKLMCWVAFDRAVKSVETGGRDGPTDRWRALRDEIGREICTRGFDPDQNTFVQHYGSKELDAALLLMPLVGFLPASDPRIRGTVTAIEKRLMVGDLIMRYSTHSGVDGLPSGEGAFLACSFWYVDVLGLMGRVDEAQARLERLLTLANDVGLLAEEYDPVERRQLGNFPQAFSHVGLINSIHNCATPQGPATRRANA